MKKLNIHNRIYRLLSLLLLLSSLPLNAAWIDRKAEGWAWYEDKEPEEKKEEVVENPVPVLTASERLEESKKNLEEKLAKALFEPTKENVRDYMLEQQIAMQRATDFSQSWAKILLSDPNLDFTAKENSVSFYGAQVQKQLIKEHKELLIRKISQEHGLFFFYKGGDAESQAFSLVVKIFVEKYGFEIMGISTDGTIIDGFKNNQVNNGLVENLGIKIVPSLFVVNPKSETITPISFGMKAVDQIEDNIFMQFSEGREEND